MFNRNRGKHPNRQHFRGVLAPLETPSDRSPAGARGKRVVLTRAAAEQALPSLVGMALDYTPALDGHDSRRKIGVITAARIARDPASGNDAVHIEGHLFAQDFPEVMRELARPRSALGLSYEVTNARVEDMSEPIWRLAEVTFTGAALLRRNKAAYQSTCIELVHESAPQPVFPNLKSSDHRKGDNMSENHIPSTETELHSPQLSQLAQTTAQLAAAAEALSSAIGDLDTRIESRIQAAHAGLAEELSSRLDRITAAVEAAPESDDADLAARVAELEKANGELRQKLQAAAGARKSLSPVVHAILAKSGVEVSEGMDVGALDAALKTLSVEQRVAVKSQMAKAGLIS